SESDGIPEHMCDVPSHDNSSPLDVSKDQIKDFSESKEEFSSTDDDSFSFDNIDYVEASPPNSELVSSEVMEIVIPKVGGIEASNDNPIPFYDPIISETPPNLTPSEESDFFLEVDAFLAVEDEPTSSQFPKSDDQSCSDEDVLEKIVSKPLPEEEIHLTKRLLYDNSSPRPPEEIVSDNSNADIESFSPSHISNLDSDPLMEEIDLSFNPDDPMPSGIEDDDYDSGRDI
nr:hypothetical protein [Tanacetum cinerariifolium]